MRSIGACLRIARSLEPELPVTACDCVCSPVACMCACLLRTTAASLAVVTVTRHSNAPVVFE